MRHPWSPLVVAGAAAVLVAGCSAAEPGPDPAYTADSRVVQPGMPGGTAATLAPGSTATRAPAPRFNAADVGYVQDMLVHHGQAIQMSSLAPERAADTQVKALASRVSDSQKPELVLFEQWLQTRRQLRSDPEGHGHSMPGMATTRRLRQLADARGTAFDKLFLTLMVNHHRGAVQMSNDITTRGTDPQVQEIAADVGAGQAAEINRMVDVSRALP